MNGSDKENTTGQQLVRKNHAPSHAPSHTLRNSNDNKLIFFLYRCLTWNNYPQDWKDKLASLGDLIRYWVAGKEIAPQTGTPHLQMYIQLTKRQRQKAILTKLQAAGVMAHLTRANGNLASNQVYCKKVLPSHHNT